MSVIVGIVIASGVLTMCLVALLRRARGRDFGSVSRTWIIENHGDRRDRG